MVRCEYSFDGGRLLVYFASEDRVDFRSLVRELARIFHTRIEMRQIGVRDEAKLLDGVGKCGRQLCCTSWLREFTPVSIRMAKNQQLPLNPDEISGVCGRLLCCLSYEDDLYREQNKKMPKLGAEVVTPQGAGRVRHIHPLKETVTVMLENHALVEVAVAELISTKTAAATDAAPAAAARPSGVPGPKRTTPRRAPKPQKRNRPHSPITAAGSGRGRIARPKRAASEAGDRRRRRSARRKPPPRRNRGKPARSVGRIARRPSRAQQGAEQHKRGPELKRLPSPAFLFLSYS